MSFPVFRHTISKFKELFTKNLDNATILIKYDPMLAYLLYKEVSKSSNKTEITSFLQMLNYLGTRRIEQIILDRDLFLDNEDLPIWVYGILSAEVSSLLAAKFSHIHRDEAFFAGLMPCLGLLFMLNEFPVYRSIIQFLIKIPIEDRVFLEKQIFGTNHLDTLKRNIIYTPFKDVVNILNKIFSDDGSKHIKAFVSVRGSSLQSFFDLALLADVSTYGAQALMFPSVFDNRELFLELAKKYFRIKESDSLEILQNAMDRLLDIAREFNVFEEIQLSTEKVFKLRKFKFESKNPVFANMLKQLFEENANDRNIYIYGERSVGRRLLAAVLYTADDNPRKDKPYVMIFCDMEPESLEEEFFGVKDGYLGKKGMQGVLKHADGGTLVIKNFSRMPKDFQDKLQKALQNKRFYRVGDISPTEFPDIKFIFIDRDDVRIKSAKGEFSKTLIKILNPFFFRIFPLRERREDIFYIANEIVNKYNLNIQDKLEQPAIVEKLKTEQFPENLRDLKRFLFLLYIQRLIKS